MMEWLKKFFEQIKTIWSKWGNTQRIIFFSIIGVVILGIILLASISSAPSLVAVINKPITDKAQLERMTNALEKASIAYSISSDNKIMVKDDILSKKAKALLVQENLIPQGTDPWQIFDVERWTLTDFERDVNLRRAITSQIEQHITSLDDIDSASITLVIAKKELLAADQDPTTASIIISQKPGSDISSNRKKIEGIERLVQFGVPGLKKENITITDTGGNILNDWASLAKTDTLDIKKEMLKIEKGEERKLIAQINGAFKTMFGEDRVVISNIKVDLDLADKKVEKNEITPIVIRPDNPDTPYDDSELLTSIPESSKTTSTEWNGTYMNPEGPAGQEGQIPPGYKDLKNQPGIYKNSENIINNVFNQKKTVEDGRPEIRRITAALAIDGINNKEYNDDGTLAFNKDGSIKRKYEPLSAQQLKAAEELLKSSIGFSNLRNDSVSVQNIQFDRSKEFTKEDDEIRKAQQTQAIVLWSLVGVAIVLVFFIIFRLISREIERRRRLREEELARQHQAMREAALRSAEEDSNEVEMSVEDRARMELQEHAVNVAREHPEEVAQLIRTWLAEE